LRRLRTSKRAVRRVRVFLVGLFLARIIRTAVRFVARAVGLRH